MIYLDNAATTFPKPEVVYKEMYKVNRTRAINTVHKTNKKNKKKT